jgi:cytochrome c551/c552
MHMILGVLLLANSLLGAPDPAAFDRDVKPIVSKTCVACHNAGLQSGGVNLMEFTSAATVASNRPAWEKVLQKVRAGEMPPKGVPRPPQPKMDAMVAYLQGEFDKADRNAKPDPGRVTVRRLNRTEYSNSVRDILGVDFRAAEEEFPTDDLGEGFDNVADVLSISPLLLEKYVAAAESIAARATGHVTLPKPITSLYDANSHNLERIDVDTIQATHRLDFDAGRAGKRCGAGEAWFLDGWRVTAAGGGRDEAFEPGVFQPVFGDAFPGVFAGGRASVSGGFHG